MEVIAQEIVDLAERSLSRLVEALTKIEAAFEHPVEQRRKQLSDVAKMCLDFGSFGVPSVDGNWAFSRPFQVLGLLLVAFNVRSDSPEILLYSDTPSWVYSKMEYFVRAEGLTIETKFLPDAPPLFLPPSWLESFTTRWPQADKLPNKILRTLGCSSSNTSLRQMLVGLRKEERSEMRRCRTDLTVFNADGYGSFSRRCKRETCQLFPDGKLDLFGPLRPRLLLRPMQPGQALDAELVSFVLKEYVHDPRGLFLEFGVFSGTSLNIIARHLQALGGGQVYGFDSFKGLPSTFEGGAGDMVDLPSGHFSLEKPPEVEANAELVIGYFNDTLPAFLNGRLPQDNGPPPEPLRFVHVDCDLASSTLEVLNALAPLLTKGCIIVFDDFVNFPGFREGTLGGLQDFLASDLAPSRLEVLGAPWNILMSAETMPVDYRGWQGRDRFDLERAVAFRVL